MSRNPFAALADDTSEVGDVPLPKQSKPTQVDAAPPKQGAPKSGKIDNAAPRRHVVGQSKVRELPASDAPAGSQAQFEGERGRDDRGTGFGRGRGGGRGRGEGRGRGGPRGGGRGGRGGREDRPDRRSATGREDSAKAEHQGWGGDEGKRELEAETEGLTDAAAEAKEGGEAKEANGDDKPAAAAPAAEEAAPAEPEDNTQTYEEYLKSRTNASIAGVSQIQARKANDGADESQWKDGVLVNKPSENTETFFAITQEQKEKARKQKEKKEKQFLEVDFLPPQRQEREGGRGGRGGARGGRGRGGDSSRGRGEGAGRGRGAPRGTPRGGRGGSSGGANINVDDNKAFPTLA